LILTTRSTKPSRYYHHHDYNKNKCRFNLEEEKKKKKKSDRRKADVTADDALNCFPGFLTEASQHGLEHLVWALVLLALEHPFMLLILTNLELFSPFELCLLYCLFMG
jgi:hypothetical protein